MNLKELIGLWVAIVAGISTPIGLIWKYWGKAKWLHWRKNKDALKALLEYNIAAKFEKILTQLNEITAEVKTNGGNSIKDIVLKIREGQKIIYNVLDVPVWVSDKDGNFIEASSPFYELTGTSEIDVLGSAWIGAVCSDDRERVLKAWDFAIRTGSVFDETFCFHRNDGRKQKVNAVAYHTKVGGKVTGSVGKVSKIGEPFNN